MYMFMSLKPCHSTSLRVCEAHQEWGPRELAAAGRRAQRAAGVAVGLQHVGQRLREHRVPVEAALVVKLGVVKEEPVPVDTMGDCRATGCVCRCIWCCA